MGRSRNKNRNTQLAWSGLSSCYRPVFVYWVYSQPLNVELLTPYNIRAYLIMVCSGPIRAQYSHLTKVISALVCSCCGQPWVWHMFFGKGLWWVMPTIKIHWIRLKHPWGFQLIVWTFVRNTVSRCLTSSSCLRVNMGCAFVVLFPVRSLYVPRKRGHLLWGHFWESLVFRLHSNIGQIYLSIEAQCGHLSSCYFVTELSQDPFLLVSKPLILRSTFQKSQSFMPAQSETDQSKWDKISTVMNWRTQFN